MVTILLRNIMLISNLIFSILPSTIFTFPEIISINEASSVTSEIPVLTFLMLLDRYYNLRPEVFEWLVNCFDLTSVSQYHYQLA